jgi:hypothetical protein
MNPRSHAPHVGLRSLSLSLSLGPICQGDPSPIPVPLRPYSAVMNLIVIRSRQATPRSSHWLLSPVSDWCDFWRPLLHSCALARQRALSRLSLLCGTIGQRYGLCPIHGQEGSRQGHRLTGSLPDTCRPPSPIHLSPPALPRAPLAAQGGVAPSRAHWLPSRPPLLPCAVRLHKEGFG